MIENIRNKLLCAAAILLVSVAAGCGGAAGTDVYDGEPSLGPGASSEYQFAGPEKGDAVAELVVRDYGSIKLKLFTEDAPRAAENFITLAQDGAYDGAAFTSVVGEYMVQCGPAGADNSYSIYGGYFEDEFSEKLHPYRGALCMANMGAEDTNSSQFFIVGQTGGQLSEIDTLLAYKGYTMSQYMEAGYDTLMEDEQLEKYYTYGGTPWLSGHNTVFGQMYDGFETLDLIMAARKDERNPYKPDEDIIIDKIVISIYGQD